MSNAHAVEVRLGNRELPNGVRYVYARIKNKKIYRYHLPVNSKAFADLQQRLSINPRIRLNFWDLVAIKH